MSIPLNISLTGLCRLLSNLTTSENRIRVSQSTLDYTLILEIDHGKYAGRCFFNMLENRATQISAKWDCVLEEAKADALDALEAKYKAESVDQTKIEQLDDSVVYQNAYCI